MALDTKLANYSDLPLATQSIIPALLIGCTLFLMAVLWRQSTEISEEDYQSLMETSQLARYAELKPQFAEAIADNQITWAERGDLEEAMEQIDERIKEAEKQETRDAYKAAVTGRQH